MLLFYQIEKAWRKKTAPYVLLSHKISLLLAITECTPVLQPAGKKQQLIPKEKENKVDNNQQQQAGGPLKGFALFMAENREEWRSLEEEAAQESALAAWKALDKTAKEEYKLPR